MKIRKKNNTVFSVWEKQYFTEVKVNFTFSFHVHDLYDLHDHYVTDFLIDLLGSSSSLGSSDSLSLLHKSESCHFFLDL